MKRSLSRFLLRLTQLLSVLVAPLLFSQPAHAAPCTSNCLKPGDYTIFTIYNLLPRKYLIHVPASYTGDRAVPLLLDFHGFSKDATNERGASGPPGTLTAAASSATRCTSTTSPF
jgi:polyhydroxybutyrate depolymerase